MGLTGDLGSVLAQFDSFLYLESVCIKITYYIIRIQRDFESCK